VWHLIGLKSRVLILLREGRVSVEDKGVTDARLVSVDVKGVSDIGGLRGDSGPFKEGVHSDHRPFSRAHCIIIHELSQYKVKSLGMSRLQGDPSPRSTRSGQISWPDT
jgi:hypothetical protein